MKLFLKIVAGVVLAGGLYWFAFYKTPQQRDFSSHLKQAVSGEEEAMLSVANDYLDGIGTSADVSQALHWYQQAAARGNHRAARILAHLYSDGTYLPAEPETALAYLQSAAQGNDPAAQYELGQWYASGKNVPQHVGQASFWYLQAAQNRFTPAKEALNQIKEQPIYPEIAYFWDTFGQARRQNPQAQLETGQAYRYGRPVLRDDEEAFAWFKKAWETSGGTLSQAAFELSDQYAKGEGVEKDESKAAALLAQAAQLQNPSAQYQLGTVAYTEEPPRLEDAFAWFSNAATQGHAQAQYMTGFMLLQGQGSQKSVPLALHFFEQAAQQNDASAQYVLGQIYTKGIGVTPDEPTGRQWMERAAENGNEAAKAWLETGPAE